MPNYATLKAPVTVDVTIYERGQGTTVAPSDESGEQATNENDDSSDEKSEEDTWKLWRKIIYKKCLTNQSL